MPGLSNIKKPLPEQAKETLVDLGIEYEIAPDAVSTPGEEEEGTLPEEERRERLQEESKERLVTKLIEGLDDNELKTIPVVAARARVRDHRLDWEAAARGEMIEVEREEAARDQAARENAAAEED